MKRILLSLVAFISTFCLYSQDALLLYLSNTRLPYYFILKDITISHTDTTQIIHVKDWNLDFPTLTSEIDSVVFTKTDTLHNVLFANLNCPDDNHPHMIDLGLPSGTKWACCNMGASSPEDYGGYYAWGETEEKDVYGDLTYKHASGIDSDGDGWFDANTAVFQQIGDDISGTEYDIAHVKWGASWQMPSHNQFWELIELCERKWIAQVGILLTGPNGASIFVPYPGYKTKDGLNDEGTTGIFWSSSAYPNMMSSSYAYLFSVFGDIFETSINYRPYGLSVRPISSQTEKPHVEVGCPDDNHPHMIDLGLPSGTKWACCNVGANSPEGYGGYYAWGETEEKSYYWGESYEYFNSRTNDFIYIGDDISGTQYDVAHVKWGGSWCMPNFDQLEELLNSCSWTWTTQNDVNGQLVTGQNGGTIFLPAAEDSWLDYPGGGNEYGCYWSSSLDLDDIEGAFYLIFDYYGGHYGYTIRAKGFKVRPVCP